MKRIGIITIFDQNNYGNRLQNYASQYIINNLENCETYTLKNYVRCNQKNNGFIDRIKCYIVFLIKKLQFAYKNIKRFERFKYFKKFDDLYINYDGFITANNCKNIEKKFDYFIVGSDQVWNQKTKRFSYIDTLGFCNSSKRISFSASMGICNAIGKNKNIDNVKHFKAISVREKSAKEILINELKDIDVKVLVDPTMLLTSEEWDNVVKKPEKIKNDEKYILNYFLGELSEERRKYIDTIAKKYNCRIINIMNKNDDFYSTGPSEFLYLEKNAFLICTDSFHSCVFSIIYNRPFIVFSRSGNEMNMNTRIENLLEKLNLTDRWYVEGENIEKKLNTDYNEAHSILENEKKNAINFLKNALDINS